MSTGRLQKECLQELNLQLPKLSQSKCPSTGSLQWGPTSNQNGKPSMQETRVGCKNIIRSEETLHKSVYSVLHLYDS